MASYKFWGGKLQDNCSLIAVNDLTTTVWKPEQCLFFSLNLRRWNFISECAFTKIICKEFFFKNKSWFSVKFYFSQALVLSLCVSYLRPKTKTKIKLNCVAFVVLSLITLSELWKQTFVIICCPTKLICWRPILGKGFNRILEYFYHVLFQLESGLKRHVFHLAWSPDTLPTEEAISPLLSHLTTHLMR